MRILTETEVRGELMVLELSEQDFCPECCGTLALAGPENKRHLKCLSCYQVFRPNTTNESPNPTS